MAGGFVYNAIDQTEVATAEIYGKALADIILKDPKVVAITADLAKSTKLGDVLKVCPERVINVGIAEQDMFGVAAGMAKAGCIPFLSGFSAFTSMRACDQLHTDICYQNVNAKIIATHAGTSFGQAGSTHHAIVDLAITRAMPNLTVIACGSCVFQAKQAAEFLDNADGLKVRVLNMHTIKPIDKEAIIKAVMDTRRIITVEDHSVIGGLGSAVSEVVVEAGKACAFKMLGHPDKFAPIGLHEDIMAEVGIDANGIIAAVREVMHKDFEEDDNWDDEF